MGFVNLYKKTAVDPKEIIFPVISTRTKNNIPDSAVQAFKKKVPAAPGKPFEFGFDHDPDTGKCQITVKKAGPDWVFTWVDTLFQKNKAMMQTVEQEIATWKMKVQGALANLTKYSSAVMALESTVDKLEKTAASGKVFEADLKEYESVQAAHQQAGSQVNNLGEAMKQFWSSGPDQGVSGLMKKAAIDESKIAPERREADADYKIVAESQKKFTELYSAAYLKAHDLHRRMESISASLYIASANATDKTRQKQQAADSIQKSITMVQGWTTSDFNEVNADVLIKEAGQFTGQSGAAWDDLNADPDILQQTIDRNNQLNDKLRVLGGRVKSECDQFAKWPDVLRRDAAVIKNMGTLKTAYDAYMGKFETVQKALREYSAALAKQKVIAQAAIDKAGKGSKIKNVPLNGIKDEVVLLAKVKEFLKVRNLTDVLKNPKVPRKEWVQANAKDGKVTITLEGKIDPGSKKGPLRLVAKAGGASSVMAVVDVSTVDKWKSADAKQMDGILKTAFM